MLVWWSNNTIDQSLLLNVLAYEGGLTKVLLIDRNISFDSLHNQIIEQFSIDYEFILVHILYLIV